MAGWQHETCVCGNLIAAHGLGDGHAPVSVADYYGEDEMNFGEVIDGLKKGRRYQREGWNGKGMFVFLVPGSTFKVNREPLMSLLGEGAEVEYHAHIDMKTAQGYVVPWLASQADMLAEDWREVRDLADA